MNRFITIGISVAIAAFVAANMILVFKDDSPLARSYYIENHIRVAPGDYARELEKEAITVPVNTYFLSINRAELLELTVQQGDAVTLGAPVANLDTSDEQEQHAEWQAMQSAYQSEANELRSIISGLQSDKSRAGSSSSSSGNATGIGNAADEIVDVTVDVQVDVEITEEGAYDQAISQAEAKLAEVERELAIVSAQLQSPGGELQFVSPVDGVVDRIEEYDDTVVVHILPSEQRLITFVEEKHWHEIQPEQRVRAYSTHLAQIYTGEILSKGTLPVTNNRWKEIHGQFETHPDLPLYEVEIQSVEPLEGLPMGANVNVTMNLDEATNAMRIRDDWMLVRDKNYAEIYTLSERGTVGRIPVGIAFNVPELQSVIVDSGLVNGQIVLDDEFRRNNSRTFFPMPFDRPTWNSIKSVNWKEYIYFLLPDSRAIQTEPEVRESVPEESNE
ncbi:hypothetical protein ACFO0S_03605 [Chryseomicrobium palamuruense]|uniref:RND efflux pump membrane fusion protein barrel-sandwich domain-containing protein n=1 Tax=Chryseomicrobium palamuruense TaxID=682973 RepID=A0ABV8US76_9BACL